MRTVSQDSSGVGSPSGTGRSGLLLGGLLRRDRTPRRTGGRWAPFGRSGERDGDEPDQTAGKGSGREGGDESQDDRAGGGRTPRVPSTAPAAPEETLDGRTMTPSGTIRMPGCSSRWSGSGWIRVGGPGSLGLTLFVGEFIVLVAYLLVAVVIEANPLARALTSGRHVGLREWLVGLWLLTAVLFHAGGAYRQRLNLSVWEELPSLFWRAGLALVTVVALAEHVSGRSARDAVAILGVAGMGSHLAVRLGAFALLREAREQQRTVSRTLVLGGGALSFKMVELLEVHREYGLLALGYLDDVPAPLSRGPAGWTYLGPIEDLAGTVDRLHIQTVVVGFGSSSDGLTAQALRGLADRRPGVQVFAVPRLFELGRRPIGQDHAGPIPLTRVRSAARRGPRWALKRAFDVAVALVALVLTSPLLLGLAVAVRLECGPGRIVLGHKHIGRRGATVLLWRFRTARPGRGPGPVGRRLRGSWPGALPMLWNLLVGDLSVVGPRPTAPHTSQRLQRMLPHYEHRLQVRSGLVGPGVTSPCEDWPPADEAVLYDTAYVESWGLWTDATVLVHGLRRLLSKGRLLGKGVAGVRAW